jgi:hypothetical protein
VQRLIRIPADIGLLTNHRMALEVAVGLAHLSGRQLSMPLDEPIGVGPGGIMTGPDEGRPSAIGDLFDVPIPVAGDEEWSEAVAAAGSEALRWPTLTEAVFVPSEAVDVESAMFRDFANGRTELATLHGRFEDIDNVEFIERPLTFYSYFFFVPGPERAALYELMNRVRPKAAFTELADRVVQELGGFNAAHIRRTDILKGIPASREVLPRQIAENLAGVVPTDEPLLVCSEASSESAVFGPLLDTFAEVHFLTDVLTDQRWRGDFMSLPSHDDHALGLVTQEVAAAADRFVGTIGSTFTGTIQRTRLLQDPSAPFLFVADYTPPGPQFDRCQFHEIAEGSFTWNRLGYNMSPDVLGWFREWPESHADLWPA